MKKLALLLLPLLSTPALADDLQNMYGLGALEPASGDESDSDKYLQIMVNRGSVKDSALRSPGGAKLGTANYDDGFGGSIAYGTEFMDPFIWEIELGYNKNDVKSAPANTIQGSMKSFTAMGNLLFELDFLPVVQPFIGAGAGYAHISDDESSDGGFAYQGIGGISFDVLPNLDLIAEYKYMRANDMEFKDSGVRTKFDYIDHNIEIGVKLDL